MTATGQGFDHSAFDRVLKKHVNESGRVDYAGLKKDPADLDAYVRAIDERSPVSLPGDFATRESKLAYWINAYNAFSIKGVRDAWPVRSVRDLGAVYGFFWRRKFEAGGKKYTLNGIEEILRKELNEPRIHFAIVCSANSCPKLERTAYTPENTAQLLEASTRFYFSEERNLKIDAVKNEVYLSRIMDFYKGDFEKWVKEHRPASTSNPLLEYVRVYAPEAAVRALKGLRSPKVKHFEYDWGVNDVNAPNPSPLFIKVGG